MSFIDIYFYQIIWISLDVNLNSGFPKYIFLFVWFSVCIFAFEV